MYSIHLDKLNTMIEGGSHDVGCLALFIRRNLRCPSTAHSSYLHPSNTRTPLPAGP